MCGNVNRAAESHRPRPDLPLLWLQSWPNARYGSGYFSLHVGYKVLWKFWWPEFFFFKAEQEFCISNSTQHLCQCWLHIFKIADAFSICFRFQESGHLTLLHIRPSTVLLGIPFPDQCCNCWDYFWNPAWPMCSWECNSSFSPGEL